MQIANCAWCNRETQFYDETEAITDLSHHICPNCLIPLLPKTFVLDKSKKEETSTSEERRKHERYPVLSKVFLTSASNSNKIVKILVLDISDTGMKVQVAEPMAKDEEITLGFMGEELVYKAVGKVKHVAEVETTESRLYQFGIKLTGIHQDLRSF